MRRTPEEDGGVVEGVVEEIWRLIYLAKGLFSSIKQTPFVLPTILAW